MGLIADLMTCRGEAKAKDIGQVVWVTHVRVVRISQQLKGGEGLVMSQLSSVIFLTEQGRWLARRAEARNKRVVASLEAVGVSPFTARMDAEGIEHHVSEERLAAFERCPRSRFPGRVCCPSQEKREKVSSHMIFEGTSSSPCMEGLDFPSG